MVKATTTFVRAWNGIWKSIKLEGTQLIKYVVEVSVSP